MDGFRKPPCATHQLRGEAAAPLLRRLAGGGGRDGGGLRLVVGRELAQVLEGETGWYHGHS